MIRNVYRSVFYAAIMMTTALLSACAAPDGLIDNHHDNSGANEHAISAQEARLMVKFSATLSESQVKHKLVNMGAQYDVHFSLIRAMSGGAYVIVVQGFSDVRQLDRLLKQIDKRADIVYIEQDRMMHHFQQSSPSAY